ncbi:anti-sigma regulatory factor (Ser/Thr protein kinase) [Kitasatospora sp. MAA4]|uniref:ATP-binding protein n=1 Tax=Kitasatospora sp. MAA4 TaxID=3035093 RepID=UPI0024749328|nr:ATP-binding protein [Kitasatospora sp. MAA4]MDH6133370.1 anti-sigma regulatory factor (Ser/Thr protein kinase) [Kitasatospora sp. MAA4]
MTASAPATASISAVLPHPLALPLPADRPASAARGSALCAMTAVPEAVPALRHFARDLALRWQLSQDAVDAVSVIVTELVANVVLHSGSHDVVLLVTLQAEALTVEVRDSGRWRPRSTPRRAALDADAVCGRGLRLVEAYASRVAARLTGSGTLIAAELALG